MAPLMELHFGNHGNDRPRLSGKSCGGMSGSAISISMLDQWYWDLEACRPDVLYDLYIIIQFYSLYIYWWSYCSTLYDTPIHHTVSCDWIISQPCRPWPAHQAVLAVLRHCLRLPASKEKGSQAWQLQSSPVPECFWETPGDGSNSAELVKKQSNHQSPTKSLFLPNVFQGDSETRWVWCWCLSMIHGSLGSTSAQAIPAVRAFQQLQWQLRRCGKRGEVGKWAIHSKGQVQGPESYIFLSCSIHFKP